MNIIALFKDHLETVYEETKKWDEQTELKLSTNAVVIAAAILALADAIDEIMAQRP